jgi:anti-sigma B factor antagonist
MAATTAQRPAQSLRGELRISIREHGTTSTIELDGEWDLAHEQASLAAVEQALQREPECLLLDLSRVSFIDSSGIHAVVSTSQRCADLTTRLVIIPGPRAVQRAFEICGLIHWLPFASVETSARKRDIPQH